MKGLSNFFAPISAVVGGGEMIYYRSTIGTSSSSDTISVPLGSPFTNRNELKAIIITGADGAYNYYIDSNTFSASVKPMIGLMICVDDRSQDKILYLEQKDNVPVLKSSSTLCTLTEFGSSNLGYDITFPDNITTFQGMVYSYTLIGQKQS